MLEVDDIQIEVFDFIEKYFDIGDFVGTTGIAFKNQRSQPTILAEKVQLLSKSISPLPNKFHGLSDTETRFRKRYLDMLDPEVQALLERRARYFSSMRRFLEDA